jgi:hypothetical protein
MANMLNMMAPHNVLRQLMTGAQLPMMGGPIPQTTNPPPTVPSQEQAFPQGIAERYALRTGQNVAELQNYWAERKRKSERAGFSVTGNTIIF